MDLCDDGHNQVCYEDRNCPACQMKDERDDLQTKLDTALDEIAELQKGQ